MAAVMRIIERIVRRLGRYCNQRHCFDYPAENDGWKKVGLSPVWGNREIGVMYDPYAFHDGRAFQMVVSDRIHRTLIQIESMDGENWSKTRDLLVGIPGAWDENVNRGCLLKCVGKWFLWYTGIRNGIACLGLAVSEDGLEYVRVQKEPVLQASAEDGVSVMNPCVLWDESAKLFKMWFSAGETYEPDVICYAESLDGIHWKRNEKPVLEKLEAHPWEKYKVGGCQVIKEANGGYTMYYIGYQNVDVARICCAKSCDGIHWNRDFDNLLLAPSKKSWDSDATYKPTVVTYEGKSYLWYNGRKMHEEYIGLAVKEGL